MRHSILKIVVLSILLFGILGVFGILSVDVENANTDETCNSVTNVFLNKTYCDRKEITIEGKVRDLFFTISDAEHRFTTFNITEENNSIVVFCYGYLRIGEGDTVRVTGTYYIEYLYKNYTFYDEIVTTPSQVEILDPKPPPNYALIGLIIITLGISILIVYNLKKKNHDLEEKNPDTMTDNSDIINNKTKEQIMGEQFVDYTKSLFDDSDWKLLRAGPDRSQEEGRTVRDDSDPDLEVQYRKNKKPIAVECKYLSFYSDGYSGSERKLRINNNNLKNYKAYQLRTKVKTYILFGVMGKPSDPKDMYLIPLNRIIDRYSKNSNSIKYLEESWFSEYKVEKRAFKIEDFIVET